jgi:hypothetical protein
MQALLHHLRSPAQATVFPTSLPTPRTYLRRERRTRPKNQTFNHNFGSVSIRGRFGCAGSVFVQFRRVAVEAPGLLESPTIED